MAPYIFPVRLSIVRMVVYSMFFFGLVCVLNTRRRIETVVMVLLLLGCFETMYGFYQTFAGTDHVWWFKKTAYRGWLTGTYINRNHFAGWLEMGLVLAITYAAAMVDGNVHHRSTPPPAGTRKWRRFFLSNEPRLSKRTFVVLAGALMGLGIIFSGSRGGMIGLIPPHQNVSLQGQEY